MRLRGGWQQFHLGKPSIFKDNNSYFILVKAIAIDRHLENLKDAFKIPFGDNFIIY